MKYEMLPASKVAVFAIWTFLWVLNLTVSHSQRITKAATIPSPKASHRDFANSHGLVRAVRESIQNYDYQRSRNKHPRSKRAVKRVCYGELGCFEDSGPFAYLEMLPSTPEEINTKFYFYSTRNRSDRPLMELPFLNMTAAFKKYASTSSSELSSPSAPPSSSSISKASKRSVNTGDETISNQSSSTTEIPTTTKQPTTTTTTKKSPSSLKHPTLTLDDLEGFDQLSVRVIVHGFGSACPHVWIYEMKTALMAVEDCIVICVDWETGATLPNYVRAAANTRLVGKQLAMLINNLKEYKNLNLTRTHLIGFSLGAHVSGFAGAELPGLARITGLDPAGPLFEAQHPKVRLDSSDAQFVDVIHSNGENLILGGLGSWQPMGDVDYYPNGGRVQTGCSNLFVGAVTDFIWSAQTADEEEGRSLCNHRRAYKFFIDSVAPRCLFPAFPCDSYDDFLNGKCFPCAKNEQDIADGLPHCGNMGYYADRSTGRGQLYLLTREEEPFCAHQFQLQIFNSFNDLPLRTIGRLEATLEGEGGLNETFKISEKEDSEFFAGDIVSKIIVPHPALGFPTTLSLNYKSYSGWLSKGLPHWDIDKVVLTDSFGRSHSICKPSTKLASGHPVRMKLLAGNCELENQDEYGSFTTASTTDVPDSNAQESADAATTIDAVESAAKQQKDIFKLSANIKLRTKNVTFSDAAIGDDLSWQPIIESNSLDKEGEAGESSRSLSSQPAEIFEPVLSDQRLAINSGRNLRESGAISEIVEPVLKATTPRHAKRAKEMALPDVKPTTPLSFSLKFPELVRISTVTVATVDKPKSSAQTEPVITVQLFPFRLGELLQRAERYARETLLPLISVQAPKFFGFNNAPLFPELLKGETRKPRYIPRFELAAMMNTTMKAKTTTPPKPGTDLVTTESQDQRNIFELLHDERHPRKAQRHSRNDVTYYTKALLSETGASVSPEHRSYEAVLGDLPTYRPPKAETLHRPSSAASRKEGEVHDQGSSN